MDGLLYYKTKRAEYALICCECGNEFDSVGRTKYCSSICRRKPIQRAFKEGRYIKPKVNRVKSLIYRYRVHDRKHNRENDLTAAYVEDCLRDASCSYCGTKENLGFDRIDNEIGHLMTNVIPACGKCNRFRGNYLTVEETKKVIQLIKTMRDW